MLQETTGSSCGVGVTMDNWACPAGVRAVATVAAGNRLSCHNSTMQSKCVYKLIFYYYMRKSRYNAVRTYVYVKVFAVTRVLDISLCI